jgi:hypothetical protein
VLRPQDNENVTPTPPDWKNYNCGRGVTFSIGAPIHVYISLLHWSQIQLQRLMKRLPKFASIVARMVTWPSSVPIDTNDRLQLRGNATIVEREVTLLFRAPIHVHFLLFHHQQRQHPVTKKVLCQSKWPHQVSIMDILSFCQSMPWAVSTIKPNPRQPECGTNSGYRKCYNCGQNGHFANIWTNPWYHPDVTTVSTSIPYRGANSTISTVQQQFQQRTHLIAQGYATPQHQVIKHNSNLQSPTASNQNVLWL